MPQPRIKIVGITEDLSHEKLIQCLKIQNKPVVCANSECKLLKYWHTKNKIFQTIIELDIATYTRIMEKVSIQRNKYLLVGYDACAVYDALETLRCFNCSGYNHTSKNCTSEKTCLRCSKAHGISDCNNSESLSVSTA